MSATRACLVSARARPSALEASSTVPKASTLTSSFATRPPPSRPVVPSSPVPERSSRRLRRGAAREALLAEDLVELVELLGHPAAALDNFCQRHDLDVAVAPDRDHPAIALDDQLDGGHAKSCGPDAVDRRRRA